MAWTEHPSHHCEHCDHPVGRTIKAGIPGFETMPNKRKVCIKCREKGCLKCMNRNEHGEYTHIKCLQEELV